jgi:hypothetical protein
MRLKQRQKLLYFVPTFSEIDKEAWITAPPLPWIDSPYQAQSATDEAPGK